MVNVNWLGDALMTTPAFGALKAKYPFIYLGVMCVPRLVGVFSDNPYIDEIIIFDERGLHRTLGSRLRFIKELRRKRFDTVFFIHRSFTRAFICFLAGIKNRIGYFRLKNFLILTRSIKPPSPNIHRQDYYLYLFEKYGIPVNRRTPYFFIPQRARKKIELELEDFAFKFRYLVGMHLGANWHLKRWPRQYFLQLANLLSYQLNCVIIFVGTDKERLLVEELTLSLRDKAYNFCAQLDLKELAALMERLDLFISNDSGPAHLAASIGIPTLVIFGPTSEKITAPRGKDVYVVRRKIDCPIPCYKKDCSENTCLTRLMPEDVFREARFILLKNENPS